MVLHRVASNPRLRLAKRLFESARQLAMFRSCWMLLPVIIRVVSPESQRSTFNIQSSTLKVRRSKFKVQRPTFDVRFSLPITRVGARLRAQARIFPE
jgi:hypothetical protein